MSELLNTQNSAAQIRQRLMAGVSALAFTIGAIATAQAKEAGRPTVWIELGGQLERVDSAEERYLPAFTSPQPSFVTIPQTAAQRFPRYDNGAEGRISFQPHGTEWILSAAIRYGRANGGKQIHEQTIVLHPTHADQRKARFSDTIVEQKRTSTILDFSAGRDVGLGMFGDSATSVVSAGVRFTQFSSQSSVDLNSDPDLHWFKGPLKYQSAHNNFAGHNENAQNFHGIGPSIAWAASAPLSAGENDTELNLDWGINAAVLFGRQRSKGLHFETDVYSYLTMIGNIHVLTPYRHRLLPHDRSRSVTVPNVGVFAGLSYRISNFKTSLGYRADFFFNAMDNGIDARHDANMIFHGPFATISIGLGG
jgi:hypothetical protein